MTSTERSRTALQIAAVVAAACVLNLRCVEAERPEVAEGSAEAPTVPEDNPDEYGYPLPLIMQTAIDLPAAARDARAAGISEDDVRRTLSVMVDLRFEPDHIYSLLVVATEAAQTGERPDSFGQFILDSVEAGLTYEVILREIRYALSRDIERGKRRLCRHEDPLEPSSNETPERAHAECSEESSGDAVQQEGQR